MRRLGSAANTDDRLDDEREFFDWLAELACEPDERFSELRETYLTDDRIRVPRHCVERAARSTPSGSLSR